MRRARRGVSRTHPAVGCLVLMLCASCETPEPPDVSGSTGETQELREFVLLSAPAASPSQGLLSARLPTVHDALVQFDSAADAPSCRGVFLRIGAFGGGFGAVEDLGEGLDAIRDAGKPVHCHFEMADNASYALMAEHCDRISMSPAGLLNLIGLAAQVFYARTLLDRIGLHADILHMGRFKGTGDTFTRDDMPEETREALGALLDDLDAALLAAVARRSDSPREAIDGGPYPSVSALDAGLIDAIAFEDEAREQARRAVGVDEARTVPLGGASEPVSFGDLIGAALGGEEGNDQMTGTRIALVHVTGPIMDGERPSPGQAVAGPFVEEMERLAEDDDVKAVVLRVDSPGGSAVASDRMWHAVRQVAELKPVIASVGNVAASGGYYIASGAHVVYAHDSSVVGSIGVVGGKVSGGDLAERIGITDVMLQRGQNSGWMSALRAFTPSEEAVVQRLLRSTYYRFIRRVAEGRELEQADVLRAAEGRVMSGRAGRELRLVDEAGGLRRALSEARERGSLPADAQVEVWPAGGGLEEVLSMVGGGSAQISAEDILRGAIQAELGAYGDASAIAQLVLDGQVPAVAMPFLLHIE